MRPTPRFLVALLAVLFLPATATADVYLQLSGDETGNTCLISDPGPNGTVTVYVLARGSMGDVGFHFAAPVPASSGLVHVSDQSTYFLNGNSQSGIHVSIPMCVTGDVLLMQMTFVRANVGTPCTFYPISQGAGHIPCLFDDYPMPTVGLMLNSDGTCNQAKQPEPADGAGHVPLTTTLSWQSGYTCFLSTGTTLFFGTDPNPPQIAVDVQSPYPVGPLEWATRYYWKVADPGAGPVWSFVTDSGVAAKSSTWGAIKALYR